MVPEKWVSTQLAQLLAQPSYNLRAWLLTNFIRDKQSAYVQSQFKT